MPGVIWIVAATDLAAGGYLLGWALRREQRDKAGVQAVGILLLLCGLLLGALGLWQTTQATPVPPVPGLPTVDV
jgi:hypothetical protein